MATAFVNITEAAKQPNATDLSKGNEFDIVYAASSQQDIEGSMFVKKMNDSSLTEDATSQSQSQNSAKNDPNLCNESSDDSQENNEFTNEIAKRAGKKKFKNFLDGDTEEGDDFISSLSKKSNAEASCEPLESEIKEWDATAMGKSLKFAIESQSEGNDSVVAINSNNGDTDCRNEGENLLDDSATKGKMKSRFQTLIDSDSEDNNESMTSENSHEEEDEKADYDDITIAKVNRKHKKSKISSLIDTDSEDDGGRNDVDETPRDRQQKSGNHSKKTEKLAKKRTGSLRASKDEAMRQIHSETQRLIRSTEISLPYHRPKQRSLQEFLNRKQFIPNLPEGLTTAAKVKMSTEIVGKILEEKEKDAELFYKSSDSEDELPIGSTLLDSQDKNDDSCPVTIIDRCNIEDTQKIFKNDVQNAHNKKEIIQQGGIDIGLPRKLFANETKETEDDKNKDITDCDDTRKKTKETRLGLKELSVPRKLFSGDYDETIIPLNIQESLDSPSKTNEIVESNSETVESSERENTFDSFVESDATLVKTKLHESTSEKNVRDETIAKENADFSNISETPFMSNKEFAKLNEKGKALRERADSVKELNEHEDSKDSGVPIGHVIGLPPPDFEGDDYRAEKLSNLKKKLMSYRPRIHGTPGTLIDLSDDVKPNREGVQSLVDRFIRHSASNKVVEVISPITVLHTEKTADGLKVIEEILPYKLPVADNPNDKEMRKPGAKYRRLKNELMEKMAKKRDEEWKLKEEKERDENLDEDEEIEEETDVEDEDEPLDEEFDVSEPEEDDLPLENQKKRKPRYFADEEAEVSDEEMETSDENVEDDEEVDDERNNREIIDDDDDTRDILSNAENETANHSQKFSRILKAFQDDSNSLADNFTTNGIENRDGIFERTKTDVDIFATYDVKEDWLSDTEAELPPSQILPRDQSDARSQLCKTPLTAVNILRFVSPITQLTAFNSCIDSPKDGVISKATPESKRKNVENSTEKTPHDKKSTISYESEKKNGFQKKLFEDPVGTVNDEELMDLCSGKFTGIENEDQCKVMESELSDLDSFVSQPIDSEKLANIPVPIADDDSQDMKLTLDTDTEDSNDKFIDKELKIESKASWMNFKVASSSDEDNSTNNQNEAKDRKKLKKKRVKKLELSDDEEDKVWSSEEEEDFEISKNVDEDKYVDYDSEENEVVIVPRKDIKKVAAGFLDEEAELSESEWGSADEDEKDLDKLEFEEGDEEDIDENEMRDELEKLHMRKVLDDDQRDVRMLQELLFDDGDLHTEGGGRERQFKWKNIDNLGDDDKFGSRIDEIDENGDAVEEDNDLEWRKQRLEREKFIEDKMKNSTGIINDELEGDSEIFKLGIKALKKSKSINNSQKEPDANSTTKPIVPRTVLDLFASSTAGPNSKILNKAVKRGSFLARGDECLARLAVQIKHSETTITTRKNPRNFVFTHISPSVSDTAEIEKDETPTNEDSPANTKGKKRKPMAGATPRTAKKAKIEVTRSTGKKLF